MIASSVQKGSSAVADAGSSTIRCDLHLHTSDDPHDRIRHDVFALIDRGRELGFHCLAVTNHMKVVRRPDAEVYAAELGMLLLTGVELTIRGRHILVISPPEDLDPTKIRDFTDLKIFRREETLMIPAHPFFPGPTHFGEALEEHADVWDAVEISHFYTRAIDFNREALAVARRVGLATVATSDTHALKNMGTSFTEVEAELNPLSIAQALRSGAATANTRALGPLELLGVAIRTLRTAGSPPAPPGHRRRD